MTASTPEDFIPLYERALASQDWALVDPLVHDDACVTFSSGAVHFGKTAVRKAFERNFALIADEEYGVSNVRWLRRGPDIAIFLFDFDWSGKIEGQPASGSGCGTSVLQHDVDGWRLLVEHLGPKPLP